MNACASCGATMPARGAFCPGCGSAIPAAAKPPGTWRRIITGIIGVSLVGFGLFVMAIGALLAAGCSDNGGFTAPAAADDLPCEVIPAALASLGVGFALVGVPFAIATFVPFGTFRRVLVGVGVAALGGTISANIIFLIAAGRQYLRFPLPPVFFYLGYWIAR